MHALASAPRGGLIKDGFKDATVLDGGFEAWLLAGYPTETIPEVKRGVCNPEMLSPNRKAPSSSCKRASPGTVGPGAIGR
jgi:hypothetical protein